MPSSDIYDVAVVGGGIQGAGVAQAAAARGYRTLLLERTEPAAATSSRSSKLIHGGLRYLESAQFGLVRESLQDRDVLLRVAPDLVRMIDFFIPVFRSTKRRPWQIRAGLSLYRLLDGWSKRGRFESLPRRAWGDLDGLRTDGLVAVFRYRDAQTDDAALTRAVLESARELDADVLWPAELIGARRDGDAWELRWTEGGGERSTRATTLVNAAGPWVNHVLRRVEPSQGTIDLDLVQGTHIEIPGTLEKGVYYGEAPSDRRAVFAIPWRDRILVGTTETPFDGEPGDARPLDSEIDYLRETFRHHFPGRDDEVLDAWAGLRVLPKGPGAAFGRSREVLLAVDDARPRSLLTVCGGKLTGYRSTAEKVLRKLRRSLPERDAKADTATLPLRPVE